MNIQDLQQKTSALLNAYPLKYAGVFGSQARGDAHMGSDIDILIDYKEPISLITLVGLERKLSAILGLKVDLVTERGVNKHIATGIFKDLQIFYGKR